MDKVEEKLELRTPEETLALVAKVIVAEKRDGFNMEQACITNATTRTNSKYKCDTVACIGGWAWLLENPDDFNGATSYVLTRDINQDDVYPLFFPSRMEDVTPEEGAMAIERYLDGYRGEEAIWQDRAPAPEEEEDD